MKKLLVAILLFVPVLAHAAPANLVSCTASASVSGHMTWKGIYEANGQSYVFIFNRPCPKTVQVNNQK